MRRVKSEIRDAGGVMFMGNARLVQGVITIIFFGILFAARRGWPRNRSPELKNPAEI